MVSGVLIIDYVVVASSDLFHIFSKADGSNAASVLFHLERVQPRD